MRRMMVPLLIAVLGAADVVTGGCSASSSITGGGGCESFCNKWVGARCRRGPTRDACLAQCLERQSKCPLETNALLKCATIEGTIACETGSGEPRILGCGPRELAEASCQVCERFCAGWSKVGCPYTPSREECVAGCLDKRCRTQHRQVADCLFSGSGICDADGTPLPSGCISEWYEASRCTRQYGQSMPFHYIPVDLIDDAGADVTEAGDGG